jgi:uncharacterized protein
MSQSTYTTNLKELIPKVEAFAKDWMNRNDHTHNYSHVHRVALRALTIAREEMKLNPSITYNEDLVYLAALLHDVTDRKYLKGGNPTLRVDPTFTPKPLREHLQETVGLKEEELLEAIEQIANNVSYTTEVKKPEQIAAVLKKYPELAVVQDADRIDSVGGIGIARVFAFGSIVELRDGTVGRSIESCMEHFDEKLLRLNNYAKTATGKKMLDEAVRRMQVFQDWFKEELATEKVF